MYKLNGLLLNPAFLFMPVLNTKTVEFKYLLIQAIEIGVGLKCILNFCQYLIFSNQY